MLKFKPIGQTLHRTDTFGVVADSVEYLKVEFDFSSSDFGGITTAVFSPFYNKGINYEVVLDDNNSCIVPEEVIKHRGFNISIYSVIGNQKITSDKFSVPVAESGYAKGETPKDPTPTVYEQLLNIVDEIKSIAKSVRDDADNGAFDGENGTDGVGVSQAGISADGVFSITLSNGKVIKLGNVKGEKGDNGTNGLDGIGITNATINPNGELVLSFSDGNSVNLGNVKGAKGEQGIKGDKGNTGESGLVELKAGSQQNIKNLDNHLYYTAGNVRLKTLNNAEMYLDLPQGTFLLVKKEAGTYGDIDLKITIWGSCTFDNIEYKYGIHQYRYNTVGGFIENSFVLDTKSIETAIANLEANKQDSLTAGAGITITDSGVISSDVGLKIIVLKDDEDLPNEGTPPKNTIYFKRNTETDNESTDWYEEYIWVNNWWELIGTTKVDLSAKQDKLSKEQLDNITAVPNKIDKTAVGNGLKFADGMLQLDIPSASASTTYGGGDAQ